MDLGQSRPVGDGARAVGRCSDAVVGVVKRLTEIQENLLAFVQGRINEGSAPSRWEIVRHFGWRSPNTAQCHLKALEAKGFLRLGRDTARTITIVKKQETFRDAALFEIWSVMAKRNLGVDGKRS